MRRIKITLAYDGTDYHGWQVQPALSTIQGTLQDVLGEIEGQPVHVEGSGRTDAGVHALAQVAAFSLSNPIPPENLKRAMNRLLPGAIRIFAAEEVDAAFNPRYDARAKTYEYRIFRGEVCPPIERRYVYHYPYPLDLVRLFDAAPLFAGEHDFSAFAAADASDAFDADAFDAEVDYDASPEREAEFVPAFVMRAWHWVYRPSVMPDRSPSLATEPRGRLNKLDVWVVVALVLVILSTRIYRLGEPAGMHFDEVYHARTATEFLQDWRYGIRHDIYESSRTTRSRRRATWACR